MKGVRSSLGCKVAIASRSMPIGRPTCVPPIATAVWCGRVALHGWWPQREDMTGPVWAVPDFASGQSGFACLGSDRLIS
jgi:hypothetical protein